MKNRQMDNLHKKVFDKELEKWDPKDQDDYFSGGTYADEKADKSVKRQKSIKQRRKERKAKRSAMEKKVQAEKKAAKNSSFRGM
jgi:hypothetical protein